MYSKYILAIGKFYEYAYILTHALLNGYKVLYVENYSNTHAIVENSNIRLIIIGKIHLDFKDTMDIMALRVPVIIAGEIDADNSIKEILFNRMQSIYFENREFKMINDIVKCIINGAQKCLSVHHGLNKKKKFGGNIIEFSIDQNILDVHKRIGKAITFMSGHYKEEIPLQKIAESAFYSPYHFSRLFKKQIGISCCKYLTNMRITKAKELLTETQMSITNICYEVGYNDLTNFERAFNRVEGLTPSAFRHSINNNDFK